MQSCGHWSFVEQLINRFNMGEDWRQIVYHQQDKMARKNMLVLDKTSRIRVKCSRALLNCILQRNIFSLDVKIQIDESHLKILYDRLRLDRHFHREHMDQWLDSKGQSLGSLLATSLALAHFNVYLFSVEDPAYTSLVERPQGYLCEINDDWVAMLLINGQWFCVDPRKPTVELMREWYLTLIIQTLIKEEGLVFGINFAEYNENPHDAIVREVQSDEQRDGERMSMPVGAIPQPPSQRYIFLEPTMPPESGASTRHALRQTAPPQTQPLPSAPQPRYLEPRTILQMTSPDAVAALPTPGVVSESLNMPSHGRWPPPPPELDSSSTNNASTVRRSASSLGTSAEAIQRFRGHGRWPPPPPELASSSTNNASTVRRSASSLSTSAEAIQRFRGSVRQSRRRQESAECPTPPVATSSTNNTRTVRRSASSVGTSADAIQRSREGRVDTRSQPESDSESGLCCICRDRRADTLLKPCLHLCLCHTCTPSVVRMFKQCPICKTSVESTLKVFVT